MADLNIQRAKDDLTGILGGTAINQITNLNALFERSARDTLAEIDPKETIQKGTITFYEDVFDYSAFSDLKGDKVIDFRPQLKPRSRRENFSKVGLEEFDRFRRDYDFTVEERGGTKVLRVVRNVPGGILVHGFDETTGWAVGGGASNLARDTLEKVEGGASLRFDIGSAGGTIENSSLTKVDLSDHRNQSSLFLAVYLPDASIITSVNLRWGSSSSDYWSRTVTTPHFGSFVNGWNLLRFDWNGATETGTVDEDNVDYARIAVVSTAADTDIRVDALYSRLGAIYEGIYYSKFLFRLKTTGVFQGVTTREDDLLNLDEDSYNIFLAMNGFNAGQQLKDSELKSDFKERLWGDTTRKDRPGLIALYKKSYQSEKILRRDIYYAIRRG